MVNQRLLKMSEELGIELVATNDVHYTYADDATIQLISFCAYRRGRSWLMRTGCAMKADNIM